MPLTTEKLSQRLLAADSHLLYDTVLSPPVLPSSRPAVMMVVEGKPSPDQDQDNQIPFKLTKIFGRRHHQEEVQQWP